MTYIIQFNKISASEMENANRKMKCPTIHPVTAGIIVIIVFLFGCFCRQGLAAFMGSKSVDVHEAESAEARNKLNRIKQQNHRHHHHPSMPPDQPSAKSQNSLPAVNGLSTDSYLIQKLQKSISDENNNHLIKT